MKKILVVEDDPAIRQGLKDLLQSENYSVETCAKGKPATEIVRSEVFDVILLDIMLPDMTGYEVLQQLRSHGVASKIMMLTSRSDETDKVLGLELGADDYLTKPFGKKELIARIHALLRRSEAHKSIVEEISFGGVRIDFQKQEAFRGKNSIPLRSREYKLLQYLFQHEGMVISRAQLLDEIWGYDKTPTTRTVDNYILSLRKKIEKDPAKPKHIITVHTTGYKFVR